MSIAGVFVPITRCSCGEELCVDTENEMAVCESCGSSFGGASCWEDAV